MNFPLYISGGAPNLRDLRLRGLVLPWSSALLSGLTKLVMETRRTSSSRATPAEFFDTLGRMPALAHLEIDNLPDDLDHFEGKSPLQLAHLKTRGVRSSDLVHWNPRVGGTPTPPKAV